MKTVAMSRFAPSLIFLLFVLGPRSRAEEVLREIPWDKPDKVGEQQGVEWLPPDDTAPFPRLKVENLGSEPLRVSILSLEKPGVTLANYALRGQIRMEGVEGEGFLEMWSHLPKDGQFFSRTLGSEGPMCHLEGSGDWRPFLLLFQNKPDGPPPERLVVNVVLPGKGKVWIGPLTLVQFMREENPLLARGQWFGPETQGWIGACVGALGGTLGTLIRWLSSRGRARAFVFWSLRLLMLTGLLSLVLGLVAMVQAQPFMECYPFLLIGALFLGVPVGWYRKISSAYEELELRRIHALDVHA